MTRNLVDVSSHDGVLHLRLDAPERRNALSRALLSQLARALSETPADTRGVVISGRGGYFSAGADFADLTGTSADETYDDLVAAVTALIRDLPVTVVAAVEGPCLGAGADLALACDLRVMAADARLGIPAIKLGLLYNPDTIARLHARYGSVALRKILLTGEPITAQEAQSLGLVDEVVGHGKTVPRARIAAATSLAALPARAATKELLANLDAGIYDVDMWRKRRRELLDSPERQAAIDTARQRHAPANPTAYPTADPKARDDD